jgi:DNA-binding NtrC family response regulator
MDELLPMPRLLIADDEIELCILLANSMQREGFRTTLAHNGETAIRAIRAEPLDVVLLDVNMPGIDGMQVLEMAREENRELSIIIITAYADIPGAVKAIQSGANNYLPKPLDHEELLRVLRQSLVRYRVGMQLKEQCLDAYQNLYLKGVMGPSEAARRLISKLTLVAQSDLTVVLFGEAGCRKDLIARAIHQSSHRAQGPFITVDCGDLPEIPLEIELFGHEKGAFTNAGRAKAGKFEMAENGTLFLDQVSNMPLSLQAKLLRTLRDKTVYREIGTQPIPIDVRLVVASNQDLQVLAGAGTFHSDLYFRLNEFTIHIPPLRDRKEDIPYLAKYFLGVTNQEFGKNIRGFTESAMEAIIHYDWPRNIRQLHSAIRRSVLLADEMVSEELLEFERGDTACVAVDPKVDVTVQKRAEEEIATLKKLETTEVMARGIAHDLNNLLSIILGSINITRMDLPPGHPPAVLDMAEKAAVRAKDLTDKFAAFVTEGAPTQRIMGLGRLVEDCALLALSGSNVSWIMSLPANIWPVAIDAGQIRQAITNVIVNAREAMPAGGKVLIFAENVTISVAEEDLITVLKEKYYLKITIQDRGKGIPGNLLEKIFDPHFSTKDHDSEKEMGFGLAITHSIVTRHGGHIEVKSEAGVGTAVDIYLPASSQTSDAPDPQQTPETAHGLARILVLEDDEMMLDCTKIMGRRIGYEVLGAKNGEEAIQMYLEAFQQRKPFDLVILDLTIKGGMGGKETVSILRKIDPTMKAVVSSGYSQDPVMSLFAEYGFDGALAKPYTMRQLEEVLHQVLES